MAYFNRRLSLCHFAPTIVKSKVTGEDYNMQNGMPRDENSFVACEHCNQPCDFVPDFVTDDVAMEMTIRRYKDGDLKYEDVQDILKDQIKATLLDLFGKIRELKYK